MRTLIFTLAAVALVGCQKQTPAATADALNAPAKNAGVADRPEQIKFDELVYEPPARADHRHEIAGGVPVYIAESHEFPLIEVEFTFKGGRYLEPDDKWGIASATSELVHHGGAGELGADETDETFAFLAADVSVGVGSERSWASINCLEDNFDEAFGLFVDMVRSPAFDEAKLALHKSKAIERMKERNDDAGDIASREWNALSWGRDHYLGRTNTAAMVESIDRDDLAALHGQIFHPGNLVISVTGDVTPDEILPKLEAALDGWEAGERAADPPAPTNEIAPGLYHVPKEIPQGKVRMGMAGVERDHPDHIALDVMNQVLGGGGFTSRLMQRIRSDEGLAYGARSGFASRVYFPGTFRATYDSKNPTVALAAKIVLEEIERIRTEPLTDEELALAKAGFIETFPRRFENTGAVVGTFVNDELTDRAEDHWQTYRDRVEAVTADDVLRVAKEHLDAEKLAILVVGDWAEIAPGDHDGRAKMSELGEVEHLPLRDPLTQEPLP